MSIREHYERELSTVFAKLTEMCQTVEKTIEDAINALVTKDISLARQVIKSDKNIDNFEREIENDCLKILLMEQPVAGDFRRISAALKMITDLERIGDQASDIAEIVVQLGSDEHIKELIHIPMMANIAISMVKDGVDSYINSDLTLARSLEHKDDEVDELFEVIKSDLVEIIRRDSNTADQAILLMMITKYLERIGDHAVNIGEWVEYSITGARSENE